MVDISDSPAIRHLLNHLTGAIGDYAKVKASFIEYVTGRTFNAFAQDELQQIARDSQYIVHSTIGQVNLTAINTVDFDLTFRFSPPI